VVKNIEVTVACCVSYFTKEEMVITPFIQTVDSAQFMMHM